MARSRYRPNPNQLEFGLTSGPNPGLSSEGVTHDINSRRLRKGIPGKGYLLDRLDPGKLPALEERDIGAAHAVADVVDRSIPMNEDLRRENWHAAKEQVEKVFRSSGGNKAYVLAFLLGVYNAPRDDDPNPPRDSRSKRKAFIGWLRKGDNLRYDIAQYPDLETYLRQQVA
ncbi:MAG TPA: hypothetical protein VJC07_00470 [Candidatus Nanoarchaeia archaeon]|nr:hypothetical protein [Candidatus Nanoarchaeia archaeon]